jgi:DNA-directed RNA polymerase subunit RPC12/RpoP
VIVGAAFLLSFIPVLMSRGKLANVPPGTPRQYGLGGGAICPRCGRPFSLRFLAINLGPGRKFDRCPHCGKWAFMRLRSMTDLRATEAAELEQAQLAGTVPVPSAEEKLHKELDDSRFQDI